MLPSIPFSHNAAIDTTTGYGVDSFIQKTELRDPWSRECFVTVVDAAVNYRGFYYPLPTTHSLKEKLEYPVSIALLNKAGVLLPVTRKVAEHLEPSEEALQSEFANFCTWVKIQSPYLRAWLDLHFQEHVQVEYKKRMHGDTSFYLTDFWMRNRNTVEELAQRVGVGPEKLLYAFDVMFRGLQYYDILDGENASYFPHPIRHALLANQVTQNLHYPGHWSWGRLLVTLIENEQIPREPEEIIQIISSLRSRVLLQEATWTDLERTTEKEKQEKIITIAAESELPAKIKDTAVQNITKALSIASILAGSGGATLFPTAAEPIQLVSLILGIGGVLSSSYWKVHVPGAIARRLRFCRGSLEWPGLFK